MKSEDNKTETLSTVGDYSDLLAIETAASNLITFHAAGPEAKEIMRLDSSGMTYKGQRIEGAGEAHRAFLEVLNQMKLPLLPPATCSAIRATEAILAGSVHGSIRWHGPDKNNQWCWQYRRADEIAAIIDRELAQWRECAAMFRVFAIAYRSHPLRNPEDKLDSALGLYDALNSPNNQAQTPRQ